MDRYESAVPLEMFFSLIGIVMLTPVFAPEQNADIDDLVSSKYVGTVKIYLIRTVYSIIVVALFTGLLSVYMSIRNCDVTPELMVTSSICNNTVIAYMIPLVYYALNYGMGDRLKKYYLFSMAAGEFEPKIWMLITGILLITASILLRAAQKKFR